MVALIGASGSGKSTLLRHISGLVCCDPGCRRGRGAWQHRCSATAAWSPDIRRVRAGIGFVFQQFNLVGRLPLIVNVLTGMLHRHAALAQPAAPFLARRARRGMEALARVGIAEQAAQRASTLSGGQQQRGAIARTLVQGAQHRPRRRADRLARSRNPRAA